MNSSFYTKYDPLTNQEVFSLSGGEIKFTPYAVTTARKYMEKLLTRKWDDCVSIGAAMGCMVCINMDASKGEQYPHVARVEHLEKVFMTPRSFIDQLGTLAYKELKQVPEQVNNPLWEGEQEGSFAIGFRGFLLNPDASLRGATGQTWSSADLEATCHGNRERCLEHLSGYLGIPNSIGVVYSGIDRRHGTLDIRRRQVRSSGLMVCGCGIYGYNTPESLARQSDRFQVFAQGIGWGFTCEAEDGFKSSDFSITKLWIVEDQVAPYSLFPIILNIDFSPLIALLEEKYKVPVASCRDKGEWVKMLEQPQENWLLF